MSEHPPASFEYTADLPTTPPLPTVPGARQDGGMQVLRRQLRQGFRSDTPHDVEHPTIEIVAPDKGSGSLLALVKNVIDGFDDDEIIFGDRQVWLIDARFNNTDAATTAIIYHDEVCRRSHDGCPTDCPRPKRRAYGCTLMMGSVTETLARPVGAKPLLSPAGIPVTRDVDSYVTELRDDVANVHWNEGSSVEALHSMIAGNRPLRVILELRTNGFADLENVAARLVHLIHVVAHDQEGLSPHEVWNAAPSVENLIAELRMYRIPDSGTGATITIQDLDSSSEHVIGEVDITRKLRSVGVPLPQIELAGPSPRIGRKRKLRRPSE